ncbi:MAG: hypothetical protein R2807_02960 [Chitinophagales bacterium]
MDEELKQLLAKELPKKVPHIFFSSLTNDNILALKDALWKMMNS